jgi:glycosyltransferase involved in cell wall biosynthesis
MNNTNIKLSIVAPVYGVEKYIRQWLESIYNQDIPETEYEVICVNDCTKDKSVDIIQSYQQQHSNLRLIHHDINKRDNAARNTGYYAAIGKYIWFNDPDDVVAPNCFKTIIQKMETYQLDMLHWSIKSTSGEIIRNLNDTNVITGVELMHLTKQTKQFDITFTWNRCYKREMLLDAKISFREERGCDVLQTLQAISAAERCMDVKECYYYYRNDNPTNYSHTDTEKAWRMMAYSFRLGKYVYELPVKNEFHFITHEAGPWRVNQVKKALLRMPIKEIREVYRLLDTEPEIKAFALKHSNKAVHWELNHPVCVILISPIYKFIRSLRKLLK